MHASIITYSEETRKMVIETSNSNDHELSTNSDGLLSFPFNFSLSKQKNCKKNEIVKKDIKQDFDVKRTIHFPRFGSLLKELLFILDKRIIILLDEWSAVPLKIQPFFAEFLRRTLFPIPNVVFKIAVVPQRKNFCDEIGTQMIGLEMGHDMKMGIDLDELYSVDADPEKIIAFCYRIMCKHISVSIKETIPPNDYIQNMFENQNAAFLLVRAAEGNPRDFIILTSLCLQDLNFFEGENYVIKPSNIIKAGRDLYTNSKFYNCPKPTREFLRKLINFVVYKGQNRGFLIDNIALESPHLKRLIDVRILHILESDYTGANITSEACSLLILNYGAYCDVFNYGKTVNFFHDGDFLEKKFFLNAIIVDIAINCYHIKASDIFIAAM